MRVTTAAAASLVIGGLMLTGCASVQPAAAPVTATASAPSPITGYDWFYHADANQASLAYGLKDSDDLRLGLACDHGQGKLELSATAPTGTRELRLESGGDLETFPAHGEPSELHDGDFLTAEGKTDAPIFQQFRRVGWIAQWHGEQRETYVAQAASSPDIERFFAFCG